MFWVCRKKECHQIFFRGNQSWTDVHTEDSFGRGESSTPEKADEVLTKPESVAGEVQTNSKLS